MSWLEEMAKGLPTQPKLAMSKLPWGSHSPKNLVESALTILMSTPICLSWAWMSCSWVSRSWLPAVVEMRRLSGVPSLA
jgi:hypothetical protein